MLFNNQSSRKIIGLDSLRSVAFFGIFLFHATPFFDVGFLGVDFFFVLSSFLLTYLALQEIAATGYFSRWCFFVRRALRIFPLYFLILIISFFIIPVFYPSASMPDNQLLYWFFLSNYETSDTLYSLKFLWSIAVEEQFYVIFICLSFLLRKHLIVLVSILLAGYFIFMLIGLKYELPIYSNTFTHFPNFCAGIIGGYFFFIGKKNIKLLLGLFILAIVGLIIVNSHVVLSHV